MTDGVVDLSRLQFAVTAMFHFLFVPLTLGLSFLLAAMETVYYTTGHRIYRTMTRFWGKILLINFALGIATGLTLEFEFGTNWSFFSSFVGDIFGAALALEGLMAFFMESTFIGLMVFGWDRLSKGQHLAVTWLVALGANLSALWILVANSFMQAPHGAAFNPQTMRLELQSLGELFFSPNAQAKFVHTSLSGYVTAAVFVCAISSWYLLRGRHHEFALRSFRMSALFGVLATAGVITLGDALGFVGGHAQPTKLAAMEAMWETERPPAAFNVAAWPDTTTRNNDWELRIPYLLTPLVTHTLDTPIAGLKELQQQAEQRIRNGIPAVEALQALGGNPQDAQALEQFRAHQHDLGYGFLVKRYAPDNDVGQASRADIERAARDVVPNVPLVFWSFRLMVGLGLLMLVYFLLAAIHSMRKDLQRRKRFLRWGVWMIPVPLLAGEAGWIVAEVGRQPWAVYEILPTWLSASAHSVSYLTFSLTGFILLYTLFAIVEVYLMVRTVRRGPDDSLGHGG